MSSLALSVLLSLVSAVAYAAAAIVQERVAAGTSAPSVAPLRNAAWWGAVGLTGVGAVLHVVALAYGPLSLVQPLGALTIVFALPMAALFVGRKAGATAWRGAVMATAGLAGLLALTGKAESDSLGGFEQTLLATVTFGAAAVLFLVSLRVRRPVVRSVLLAGAAGIAFGVASVFTKTVAVAWTSGSLGAGLPTLLVIAGLATAGMLLSQAAYRGAGLAAPLATVTVVNPVVAAAVGIAMFGEDFRYGATGTLLALGCGIVAAGGLVLLTTERLAAQQEDGRDPEAVTAPAAAARAEQAPVRAEVPAVPAEAEAPALRSPGRRPAPTAEPAPSRERLRPASAEEAVPVRAHVPALAPAERRPELAVLPTQRIPRVKLHAPLVPAGRPPVRS
ncbi:DMT family transporter [Streptomyces sp. NPDC050504]|uniref:DMT family transporter n=1 Tax=Streptomyces sp. NPDC050504 TaxID=3365618 RepID=UPI00379B142C